MQRESLFTSPIFFIGCLFLGGGMLGIEPRAMDMLSTLSATLLYPLVSVLNRPSQSKVRTTVDHLYLLTEFHGTFK
jgi:hypothetical protein